MNIYKPLIDFWIELRDNGCKMSDDILILKEKHNNQILAQELFNDQIKIMKDA